MPARVIHAVKAPDGYHFKVHLDTSLVEEETGEPTPASLREWTWGLPHAAHQVEGRPMTEAEYLESIQPVLAEMIAREQAILAGTKPGPDTHPIVPLFHDKEF